MPGQLFTFIISYTSRNRNLNYFSLSLHLWDLELYLDNSCEIKLSIQHLINNRTKNCFFRFFGHPEVYILIIPAFGIISIIISSSYQKIIFGNQSMIFAMSCISLLGSLVWGHHMYTVGLETDTRAYFTGVTILISLPTGTKIFNWLSTYLGNPPLLHLKTTSGFFGLLFLLMFTIGGSTGIILGNAAVDLGLHDTYYVVAHFHFVLSLGAVIAIFSGIIFNGEKILGSRNLLPSSSSTLSLYHLVSFHISWTSRYKVFTLGFRILLSYVSGSRSTGCYKSNFWFLRVS